MYAFVTKLSDRCFSWFPAAMLVPFWNTDLALISYSNCSTSMLSTEAPQDVVSLTQPLATVVRLLEVQPQQRQLREVKIMRATTTQLEQFKVHFKGFEIAHAILEWVMRWLLKKDYNLLCFHSIVRGEVQVSIHNKMLSLPPFFYVLATVSNISSAFQRLPNFPAFKQNIPYATKLTFRKQSLEITRADWLKTVLL